MTKVGVILSGCGYLDGAEIQEAVSALIALSQAGVAYRCLAPSKPLRVVDHLTGTQSDESRDVLTESARIARGEISDLAGVKGDQFDAFVLPGGFGVAKNLCTFAAEGPDCEVDPEVSRVLREAHAAGRPIGFACIAPALCAKVFGDQKPKLTIGHDAGTAGALESLGASHTPADVPEIVTDSANRFVSTPAYMEETNPADVFAGVSEMVRAVLAMVSESATA